MIYLMGATKVIHFEPPTNKENPIFNISTDIVINDYPIQDGNKYPFMIQWKFRFTDLNEGKEIGGSYLAESDLGVKKDNVPHDIKKLDRLIGDLYMNVEMQWQDRTPHTSLAGNTLPRLTEENIISIRENVLSRLD